MPAFVCGPSSEEVRPREVHFGWLRHKKTPAFRDQPSSVVSKELFVAWQLPKQRILRPFSRPLPVLSCARSYLCKWTSVLLFAFLACGWRWGLNSHQEKSVCVCVCVLCVVGRRHFCSGGGEVRPLHERRGWLGAHGGVLIPQLHVWVGLA